jgi:hypothetical protein
VIVDTAGSLLAVLRRHYLPDNRPAGGVFAAEIESPDGKRRADAVWMPTTWAGGQELIGHEIKVTRADVLVELADPTKHDAWARYCDRWWLVVSSPALVDGLDVPEHWGIMAPPSGRRTRSMTIVRPAPKLTPIEAGAGYRRMAVWLANRRTDDANRVAFELQQAKRELAAARQDIERMQSASLAGTHKRDPLAEKVLDICRRARAEANRRHIYLASDGVDAERVVRALIDVEEVDDLIGTARFELRALQHAAETLLKPFERTARELSKLEAPAIEAAS